MSFKLDLISQGSIGQMIYDKDESITFKPANSDNYIKVGGYGKWLEKLCEHYPLETILFRRTEDKFENALLRSTNTKNIIIGVFDNQSQKGKIFDRRSSIRRDRD